MIDVDVSMADLISRNGATAGEVPPAYVVNAAVHQVRVVLTLDNTISSLHITHSLSFTQQQSMNEGIRSGMNFSNCVAAQGRHLFRTDIYDLRGFIHVR